MAFQKTLSGKDLVLLVLVFVPVMIGTRACQGISGSPDNETGQTDTLEIRKSITPSPTDDVVLETAIPTTPTIILVSQPGVVTALPNFSIRAQGKLTLVESQVVRETPTPAPDIPSGYIPPHLYESAERPEAFVDLDNGRQEKSLYSDLQLNIFGGSDTYFGFAIPNAEGLLVTMVDNETGIENCLLQLNKAVKQERLKSENLFEEASTTYTYCVITSEGRLSIIHLIEIGWNDEGNVFAVIDFTSWEKIVLQGERPPEG